MFFVFIYEGTHTSDLIVSYSVVIIGLNLTWEGVQPSKSSFTLFHCLASYLVFGSLHIT